MLARRIVGGTCLWVALGGGAASGDNIGAYFSDQTQDVILRLEDLNDDGDTLNADEVIIDCDENPRLTSIENTQGTVMLGPGELLAADNFTPVNVVHLVDLNGDVDLADLAVFQTVLFADLGG